MGFVSLFIYTLRNYTNLSLGEIGEMLGMQYLAVLELERYFRNELTERKTMRKLVAGGKRIKKNSIIGVRADDDFWKLEICPDSFWAQLLHHIYWPIFRQKHDRNGEQYKLTAENRRCLTPLSFLTWRAVRRLPHRLPCRCNRAGRHRWQGGVLLLRV